MANTDKDILITPNIGSSNDPKIEFKGASSTVGPSTITATIYPLEGGTLSFDGSQGSLFSISNNLTSGSIFSVNPISGIPIIDINADRTIALNPYGGNTGIGLTNPSYKLDVNGVIRTSSNVYNWNTSTPGTGVGGIHLGSSSATSDAGPAITFGARDSSSGTTAQAGIYVNSDGTYGTRMYFATTNSYAVGSQSAMSIDDLGVVSILRTGAGLRLPSSGYIGLSGGTTYGIGVLSSNRNSGVFDTLESTGSDPLELNYYQGGAVKIGSGDNGSKSLYAVGIYDNGNVVLHAGNYTSYVGNGTITVQGTTGLSGSGTFTTNQNGNTSITLTHADTSTQASVDNSDGIVIQDVTLDEYGHVTALGSTNVTHKWEWRWIRYATLKSPASGSTADWTSYYKTYFIERTAETESANQTQDSGYINTKTGVGSDGGFGGSNYGNIFGGSFDYYHCHIFTNIYVERQFTVNITNFNGDDPHAIFIDGVFVHGNTGCCVDSQYNYTFTQGWHRIDLIYSEGGGGDFIRMGWNPKDYTDYITDMTPYYATDNGNYLLDRLKKVDGSGSGLDADLLDGQSGSYYTTAGNLSGTIPSGVLGNSTVYVGTTAIALNRSSATQTLTGVSIDGSAAQLNSQNASYYLDTSANSQSKSGNLKVTAVSESWAEGISVSLTSSSAWGGYRLRRERGGDDGNWAFGYTALDTTDDLVFVSNNSGSQVNNILRLTKNARIGVNNASPLQTLDVRGNFLLAADGTTSTHITQKPYTINNGTLSWEGSAGQLFSITNNLTSGSIFSVNDVSGIPSIDVDANGTILFAPYGGNIGVGTLTPAQKLHVIGSIIASSDIIINQSAISYSSSDNTAVVGSITANKLHVNGSIQLTGNNDAIVFGRGTSSFMKDEEIGFGWGGGWYMTDSTYLRVRGSKTLYNDYIIRSDFDVRAPIFRDQDDPTNYYLDPNGTSELSAFTSGTYTRMDLPFRKFNRQAYTSDSDYWTGTRGWGATFTWDGAWSYGFGGFDIWGTSTGHPQGSGYIHAQGIQSGLHYATSNNSSAYGWQLVGAADAGTRLWYRGRWGGSLTAWCELAMYDVNVGGNLYANVYYDSNDPTNYYIDPASTTTSLQIAGAIEQGNNFSHPNIEWSAVGSSTGMVIFKLPGDTSNYGMVHMVFDYYEYNSPRIATIVIGGHNWGGAWYNTGCNVVGYIDKQIRLGVKDGQYCVVFGTSGSSWSYGTVRLRKIHNGSFYNNIMDLGGTYSVSQTTTESFTNISGDLRQLRTPVDLTVDEKLYNGELIINGGTRNNTNDATAYITATNNNDWGLIINKFNSSATEYGMLIHVGDGASYALRIMGSNVEKFRVAGSGNVYANAYYGDGSNLTGITAGATLSAASGSQRVVLTSLTSGTMTTAATDADLAFDASTNTLSSGVFTSTSDKNKKKNIRRIENASEILNEIRGVRFDWKSNNQPSVGVIAQEVEKVLPELVHTIDDGTKTVSYGNLVAVLIEALKEQQEQIDELKKAIKTHK